MAAAAFITICGSTETRFGYFSQETSNSASRYLQQGLFYCMRYKHDSFTAPSTELAVRLRCVYSNVELNIAVAFEKCARERRNGQHRNNNPGKKSHARNIRLIRLRPRPSTCSGPAIALRSSTEQTRRARDSCSHRSSSPTKRRTAGEPRPFDRH